MKNPHQENRMQLDIRHWEMLTAIAELGTMRAAAGHLGLTQSALSHRLAEAERRLGGALFHRDGRRLRLAAAGQAMVQAASQALPVLARAETDFLCMNEKTAHVVRFGIAAYSCYHWLPHFLGFLGREEPRIQVEVVAAATQQPVRSLLDGTADVVLAPGHLATPGIATVPLFDDELVLVVSKSHPLATKPYAEAEDLRGEVYLTYSRTTQPGFEYERFIRPSGVIPRLVNYVEMTDAIIELIASGFGISILANWALQPALATGRVIALRVGRDGLDLGWSTLLRAADLPSSPARAVADLLAKWCDKEGPTSLGIATVSSG